MCEGTWGAAGGGGGHDPQHRAPERSLPLVLSGSRCAAGRAPRRGRPLQDAALGSLSLSVLCV